MSRKAATARRVEAPEEASLPGVLIPPGQASASQKDAYWIELLDNPDELRKAIGTTDFFQLLREFPQSLWGDRLSIYVYRLPDDDGMMVKNEVGARKYIKPIIRQPIDEDWIATKHGGGKYLLYLKLDNKESLKETTVRIDGAPKLQAGQTVEIDGKPVAIAGAAAPAPSAVDRSDVAAVIEASANANKQNMEILAEGSKAAIQLVRDQATNAAKPDASTGLMDKFMTAMIDRMMTPPPAPADPIESFLKLQAIISKQNPEPIEQKDPPLVEAMELVEKMSGGRSFAELIKGKGTAAPESAWAPFAPVALQFVTSLPGILAEFRLGRQAEQRARDLQFKRDMWMRTAKPGETPPLELMAVNEPQPVVNERRAAQPAAESNTLDPAALVQNIINMVAHGFDNNPYNGGETAAAIAFNFGKAIEAAGLEAAFTDAENIARLVEGTPALKQRSTHAKWPQFQQEFLVYMDERFGEMLPDEPPMVPANGPQPVA